MGNDSGPAGFPVNSRIKGAGQLKLNDPFGRVSSRNEASYRSLRDRLQQEGIRDSAAVSKVTAKMTATMVKSLALLFGLSMVLALFFPTLLIALLGINILILLWVSAVYLKTRLHLKRYLYEVCRKS